MKLKSLKPEEVQLFKDGLAKERDSLQASMAEARSMRADIRLQNRSRYVDFQQKIGELSLTFGGALIPLVIATDSLKDVEHPGFVFIGAAMYLVNGILGLWTTKQKIEQDGNDAPHIGLDEEIHVYPMINAKNKLILDPDNEEYAHEYLEAEKAFLTYAHAPDKSKASLTVWADILIFNFVLGSLLVAGAVWPYSICHYWLGLLGAMALMILLGFIGYILARKKQKALQTKQERLAKIRRDFSEWRDSEMRKN